LKPDDAAEALKAAGIDPSEVPEEVAKLDPLLLRSAGIDPLDPFDMRGENELSPRAKNAPRRGYDEDYAPRAKTRERLEQVLAIFDAYEAQRPLTVRQVLYMMKAQFGHPKSIEGPLYYLLGRARRARIIPFEWIRDDGIVAYSPKWHDGPEAFWDEKGREIKGYRRDRQAGQAVRIELWCEAAGMAPQLARVADDYSVEVFTNSGGNSITAVRHVVNRALARDVPTVLLHVGDFDPYGEFIFNALVEDAAAFLDEDRIIGTQEIEPVRVALTGAQVTQYALPTQPTKKPKTKAHTTIRENWIAKHDDRTCEAEALPPDLLAKIVREAIEDHLDPALVAEQIEAEERDRIELTRALPSGEVGS
jgi:hypothetical protein